MGAIFGDGIVIHGNFTKLRRYKTKDGRPRDRMRDYKAIVPYFLKWRHKIGKVECDCTELEEHYMPYYGPTWYHMEGCALLKAVEANQRLKNLWQYQTLPGLPIDYDQI